MTTMLLGPADLLRRRGLRRMRAVALSLLGLAAVVFVLTRNRDGAWGFVNATAEAAMVGALADWFAVTPLFRPPLGLAVPQPAITPHPKHPPATPTLTPSRTYPNNRSVGSIEINFLSSKDVSTQ